MFQAFETRGWGVVRAILLGVAALAAGCSSERAGIGHAQAQATDRLTEARALVDRGATLLDVRTWPEWERGHLEGAMLIPVQELTSRLAELPRDRAVVVYCASGRRSARAAEMLRRAGYEAHDLGGMPAASTWSGAER